MKKFYSLLLPIIIIILFSACKYEDYDIDNLDSKISELKAYNGDNVSKVINKLKKQGLYIESNVDGVVKLTNNNGSIVYILINNNNNRIIESVFEYYTNKPSYALDRFGKWHNTAYNLSYSKYYFGEIEYFDKTSKTYSNEKRFMDDFEAYGVDIYNCYEEWNSNYYGCFIEYSTINISTRKISVGCFEIDGKNSKKKI